MSMPSLDPEETPLGRDGAAPAPCAAVWPTSLTALPLATPELVAGELPAAASRRSPTVRAEPARRRLGADRAGPLRRPGAARDCRVTSWPGRSGAPSRRSGIPRSWRVPPSCPGSSRSIRRRRPGRGRSGSSPAGPGTGFLPATGRRPRMPGPRSSSRAPTAPT